MQIKVIILLSAIVFFCFHVYIMQNQSWAMSAAFQVAFVCFGCGTTRIHPTGNNAATAAAGPLVTEAVAFI